MTPSLAPFLALAWPAEDARAEAAAAAIAARRGSEGGAHPLGRWRVRLVLGQESVIAGRAGMVLGQAYAQGGYVTLPAAALEREQSAAAHAREVWGPHIALLAAGDALVVYRSPDGGAPCVIGRGTGGLTVLASRVEDALPYLAERPRVDWEALARTLASGFSRPVDGVSGVKSLAPGNALLCDGATFTPEPAWAPAACARDAALTDPAEAAHALREAVRLALHAALPNGEKAALLLSGGVDSSLVAVGLAEFAAPEQVVCLNFVTAADAGDERAYARAVSQRLGFTLMESAFDETPRFFEEALAPGLTVRPNFGAAAMWQRRIFAEHAAKAGAQVLLSGGGGDAVLGHLQDAVVAADHFCGAPNPNGFLAACLHAAQLSGRAAWEAGAVSVRAELRRRLRLKGKTRERDTHILFLQRDALDFAAAATHEADAYADWGGLPAAKNLHLASTIAMAGVGAEYTFACGIQALSEPLLSQPVMEACFRIPVSVLTQNGWDRGLARQTYAPQLPEFVMKRRTKGDPMTGLNGMIQANRAWLREFLCDGVLVREGLVDGAFLARALQPDFATRSHGEGYESNLMMLVAGEQWAKQWSALGDGRARLSQAA